MSLLSSDRIRSIGALTAVGDEGTNVMYRPILATLAVTGVILGGVAGVASANENPSSLLAAPPVDVRAEPAAASGIDPFVPPGQGGQGAVLIARTPGVVSGNTPGLYGGTLENACDSSSMVAFLYQNPDRGRAFAAAEGIAPTGVADFVAGLTPVTLRSDTAVTNNGFANGSATPFQAVLQAGTAVLVDKFGMPRARCACGNPLESSQGSGGPANYTGDTWAGLSSDQVSEISPSATPINEFELVTPTNGTIGRPTGSHGDHDNGGHHGGSTGTSGSTGTTGGTTSGTTGTTSGTTGTTSGTTGNGGGGTTTGTTGNGGGGTTTGTTGNGGGGTTTGTTGNGGGGTTTGTTGTTSGTTGTTSGTTGTTTGTTAATTGTTGTTSGTTGTTSGTTGTTSGTTSGTTGTTGTTSSTTGTTSGTTGTTSGTTGTTSGTTGTTSGTTGTTSGTTGTTGTAGGGDCVV